MRFTNIVNTDNKYKIFLGLTVTGSKIYANQQQTFETNIKTLKLHNSFGLKSISTFSCKYL